MLVFCDCSVLHPHHQCARVPISPYPCQTSFSCSSSPFCFPPSSSLPCPPSSLPSPPLSTSPSSSSFFTPPNMCEVVSDCDFDLHFPKDSGGSSKKHACQCRRHRELGLIPGVRKIPWRTAWKPTPVFLSGESHGQRSLVGFSL